MKNFFSDDKTPLTGEPALYPTCLEVGRVSSIILAQLFILTPWTIDDGIFVDGGALATYIEDFDFSTKSFHLQT